MVNLNIPNTNISNTSNSILSDPPQLRVRSETTTTKTTSDVQITKKNSFTDRANKLIKQFELLNNKLENNNNNNNSYFSNKNSSSSDSEEAKIISSLLLPSQYIDLSLFFYSPNQSEKDKDLLLQNSTDSSVFTSSTISNTSSSSVSNTSSLLNNSENIMATVAISNNTHLNLNNNNSTISSNDEHEELIAEMEIIERLPTQERLKQAKRRRALQLKKWNEFDAKFSHTTINSNSKNNLKFKNNRNIKFQHHIVLLDAIMRKDCDEVERLLQSGITPNSANEDGLTAIHQCCIDDSADLLKLLIKYGADVNVCDNDLWTPLHAAATCANLEICKILIENNANLLAVNTDGNMPYDICEDEICLEFIESEMASRGVTQQTIDIKRSESEFRMLEDLKTLCLEQIYMYLKSNKKLSLKNLMKNINNNFFNYFNNDPITSEGKLDLNTKDQNGATLLHIAAANGYNTVIEFLLIDAQKAIENGAPIINPSLSVRDNDGWTPLHVATFWGHQRSIELLLEAGADINLRTKNDETVVDLCDDPDVKEFIIQKSKEIETEEAQRKAAAKAAAAAAVMQSKLQLISSSNNSLNNGSFKGTNSSSRSLKRTSTGVSRSSSVRRSSFREKEKAARKLDTSFKDFLYATESQENQNGEQSSFNNDSESHTNNSQTNAFFNNQYSALNEEGDHLDESYKINNQKSEIQAIINPIVINHKDQLDSVRQQQSTLTTTTTPNGNKKLTSVVKIINNNNSTGTLPKNTQNSSSSIPVINIYDATPTNQNKFIDDFNNNQLKLNNEANISTLTAVSQIARIQSTGAYNGQANNGQNLVVSNHSMSTSLVSTSTLPQNASNLSQNTVSTSSIAIVDVSSSIKSKKDEENQAINVKINQPNRNDFDKSMDDGVKYRFISNQTIGGVNKTVSEFDDFNIDSENSHGHHKRLKCFKCCSVM